MKTKMKLIILILGLFSVTYCLGINDFQSKITAKEKNIYIQNSRLTKANRDKANSVLNLENNEIKFTKFEESECDLVSEGPICLFNGDRVLLPFASPNGLVGYWNFDDIRPLDNSGKKNHGVGVVKSGPAFGGFGSSAFFSAGDYITIPSSSDFQSSDFTMTFWFFLVQDFFSSNKGIRFCPLIQRGNDDLLTKNYQRAPALYFDRKEKILKFYVKTSSDDATQGENVISNAKLANQRWLHIGIVKSENKLKVYVNGILDSQGILKNSQEQINAPMFIGNVPWLKDQCDFPFYIDELRYYNIALDEDIIQAEAAPVLGGIEPNFLQLGCMDCSLKSASQSCIDGYRLCTSIELHTGGYQIARSMGWLNWNTHIWTHGALKTPSDFEKLKGLALCCAELK